MRTKGDIRRNFMVNECMSDKSESGLLLQMREF